MGLWCELHVEVEDDTGKYEAQLDERKTEPLSQHNRSQDFWPDTETPWE